MNIPSSCPRLIALALLFSLALAPGFTSAAPSPQAADTPKAGNIVFVDNVNGDDANPGTASAPKATIQAGEDTAEALYGQGGTVVVWGGGPAYEEGVAVTSSMKLCGNGKGIPGVERDGPPPLVNGAFSALELDSLTIRGFEIRGTIAGLETIGLYNIGEAVCSDNYIHELSFAGIAVVSSGSRISSARVENNRIVPAPGFGYGIYAQSNETSKLTLHASNNTVVETSLLSYAFYLLSNETSELNVIAEGNYVDGGAAGMWVMSEEDSRLTVQADKNEFLGSEYSVVRFESYHGSDLTVKLTGNTTEASMFYGAAIEAYSYGESNLDLVAMDNTDIGVASGPIGFVAQEDSTMNAWVERNHVTGVGGSANLNGVLNFTAHDNDIRGDEAFNNLGIVAEGVDNSVVRAAITNNRISGIPGYGIFLRDFGTATVTVTALDQNQVTRSAENGIFVDLGNPASSVNGTKNNVVHDSAGNSLEVVTESVNGQIKLNGAIISPLVDTP